jgi:hypothetical protein
MDEASIYNRPLSASEIKAIYNLGSAGKFDAKVSSPQNLAEAKVSLAGQTPITINGSNNTWQTNTIAFLATTNATALQIDGLEPGMLLDSAALTSFTAITNTVTNIVAVVSNLYYLPEQSLDAVTGEGAYGNWQLEIQDDRAGAGLTNSLVSWNLQFVFANTNAIPAVVGGGVGQTNQFIVPGRHRLVSNQRADECELRHQLAAVCQRAGECLVRHEQSADNILFLPTILLIEWNHRFEVVEHDHRREFAAAAKYL